MLLTDYFYPDPDVSWEYSLSCGVRHGVIRLPDEGFDVTSRAEMRALYERFTSRGITPVAVEPMPDRLHFHIKRGDERRDECIENVIAMIKLLSELGIKLICFNFMANIGWYRTTRDIAARGGAKVTGFCLADFDGAPEPITKARLWENYEYFVKAVTPYAEKYGVRLALHPDDPPVERLGAAERIFTSAESFRRAMAVYPSECLGITFCQANFYTMGEDVYSLIKEWREKIFFVHFRNVVGTREDFRETFHDEGAIDMAKALRCYAENGVDVPVRVDHVPEYKTDTVRAAGYGAVGKLFAIGYLKGLLECCEKEGGTV